jgi:hypothetical protein
MGAPKNAARVGAFVAANNYCHSLIAALDQRQNPDSPAMKRAKDAFA